MHSISFEPYVLDAVHHWQEWNASSFLPWHFKHGPLPRMSGTCIGVRDGCLLSVSRGPRKIAWPLRLVEWDVRRLEGLSYGASGGKGGGVVGPA